MAESRRTRRRALLGMLLVIFVSVGTMLPFERLVRGADDWARQNPLEPIFIQIGNGEYQPQHAPWTRIMPIAEYRERLETCDLFVAHAGIGSILQAVEFRKQQLLLPRHQSLGEHTTDHQLDTIERFGSLKGVRVVDQVSDLQFQMSEMLRHPLSADEPSAAHASPELLRNISTFFSCTFSEL
jgi:UDP-N-acetylglucosamine transferase subunit ALG13